MCCRSVLSTGFFPFRGFYLFLRRWSTHKRLYRVLVGKLDLQKLVVTLLFCSHLSPHRITRILKNVDVAARRALHATRVCSLHGAQKFPATTTSRLRQH